MNFRGGIAKLVGIGWAMLPGLAQAQWDVFEDPEVESECGVVNAVSLEFAVRSCDGAMVLITGDDVGFSNAVVTAEGTVEIDGEFGGYVVFEQDADGFYTLWWVSEAGYVIDFDDVNFAPFETDYLPEDFENVPCDAAEFWTEEGDCDAEFGDEAMLPVAFVDDGEPVNCGPISLSVFLFSLAGLGLTTMWHRGRSRGIIKRPGRENLGHPLSSSIAPAGAPGLRS